MEPAHLAENTVFLTSQRDIASVWVLLEKRRNKSEL